MLDYTPTERELTQTIPTYTKGGARSTPSAQCGPIFLCVLLGSQLHQGHTQVVYSNLIR